MRIFHFLAALGVGAQTPSLDYTYFRDRVQPVFLKKRPGHARCVACHIHRVPALEKLAPGATNWSEEQSRKNYAAWRLFTEKMLAAPLAAAAGGSKFHPGGKHFSSKEDPEWKTLAAWARGATEKSTGEVRVLQSNSAGDDIHVIDTATNTVVGGITGIEVPHGLVISPDGTRIYVTNEALVTLDVVESRSFQIIKRIPLSGKPNNVDVAKDGKRVYVGIREGAGAVDIIDAA